MRRVWFVIVFVVVCQNVDSVRFQHFGVPGSVTLGKDVWLDCGFDLQEDELYSVKWYKDNYEFYRYLPGDNPPSQQYNLDGVFVELSVSNASHVFLKSVILETEGTYACEVSTNAPSFMTVRAEKEMRIYVMPDTDPLILGVVSRYSIDDIVNATCFFGPSKPPAALLWYINGELADETDVVSSMSYVGEEWDLASVESQLQFVLNPSHLIDKVAQLECTADVSQVFSKSSEEIIFRDITSSFSFQRVSQAPPGQKAPVINGMLSSYEVGHLVDVNCTSDKSDEPATLYWDINDEEASPDFLVHLPLIIHADGTTSSELGLRFRIRDEHFIEEEMSIKCTSLLSRVIQKSSVETLRTGTSGGSGKFHSSGGISNYFISSESSMYYFSLLLAIYHLLVLS